MSGAPVEGYGLRWVRSGRCGVERNSSSYGVKGPRERRSQPVFCIRTDYSIFIFDNPPSRSFQEIFLRPSRPCAETEHKKEKKDDPPYDLSYNLHLVGGTLVLCGRSPVYGSILLTRLSTFLGRESSVTPRWTVGQTDGVRSVGSFCFADKRVQEQWTEKTISEDLC